MELRRPPYDWVNVTAVAMVVKSPGYSSRTYYLMGHNDGCLTVMEAGGGGRDRTVFKERISDYPITAVAWEGEDWNANVFIFYAGDAKGNLYTVNRKGKIVKETSIPERKGGIHVIATTDKNKIYVYTSKGRQVLSHITPPSTSGWRTSPPPPLPTPWT